MKKPKLSVRRGKETAPPTRITNETVAEHRERILAGGRRFKYPVQYARHRLVINAILIAIVAVIVFIIVSWQQLYLAQNTSTFFYRLTGFIPVPVASVNGDTVRYSDYLLYYNGSAHYLQQGAQVDFNSSDGKAQQQHIKRESLTDAEGDTYAAQLARKLSVTVSDKEVDIAINQARQSYGGISTQVYDASALSVLGWTPAEYRHVIQEKLLRQKVSYAIDTNAQTAMQQVETALKANATGDFENIVNTINGSVKTKAQVGTSGMVPLDNSDGGLSQLAGTLQVGGVSAAFKDTTGRGYFFVKLLAKTSTQLNYTYIEIPLTEFSSRFAALQTNGKISEYISVKDTTNTQ